jgi:SOS response regulatory protein OraA/RecX
VPDEAVVRAGLEVGLVLDRAKLRDLGRELRRAEALSVAVRALARGDLSRSRLEGLLERGRVRPAAARQALETLEQMGLMDDGRAAETRAVALADRGWGDAAIAAKLEGEGFAGEAVRAALAGVVPESERAARVAATERDLRRAYGVLARRGFREETIEEALGSSTADLPKE